MDDRGDATDRDPDGALNPNTEDRRPKEGRIPKSESEVGGQTRTMDWKRIDCGLWTVDRVGVLRDAQDAIEALGGLVG